MTLDGGVAESTGLPKWLDGAGPVVVLGALCMLDPGTIEAATFTFRKQITIGCAQIQTPPHVDFPVLVSVVDPDLRNAPLGRVRSANGADIAFMNSNGGPLNHELEKYNPATGQVVAWVTVPSLGGGCPGTPTTLYMYYGDPEITCPETRILGVPPTWDSNFRYLFHMGQSGTGDPLDSSLTQKTAVRNPTSDPGISNAYAAGIIGNAIDLVGSPVVPGPQQFMPTTPTHVRINDGALVNNQPYTIEGWFFMRTLNPAWVGIVTKNRDGGFDDWAGLYKLSNGFAPPNPMGLGNNTGGDVAGTTSLAAGQWYYGAVSWDGTNRRVYRYDLNETTDATAVTLTSVLNPSRLGDDSNGNYLDGLIDEVRFSNSARAPGWLGTSARNQGCPSSTAPAPSCSGLFPASLQTPFATFGAEQLVPTNYRSIGGPGAYAIGTVSTSGTSIVTGVGTGWVAANRGRGDLITINGTTYTVRSVDSPTQITVYGTVPLFSGGYSISRMFTSLAAWEDCMDGPPGAGCPAGSPAAPSTNFITDDRREVGVVFKDVPLVGQVTIGAAFTLGRFHDITLTADPGNRHTGLAGTGVIIDNNTALPAIQTPAGNAVNHLTIEWLEIKNGLAPADGIQFSNTTTLFNKLVVRNCLIHNVAQDGINVNGVANDGNGLFYNNFIHHAGRDGIGLQILATGNSSWLIYNNTIFQNSRHGIFETAGAAAPVYALVNNISTTNVTSDFNLALGDINAASSNNLSGDATAPGFSPLLNVPLISAVPLGVNFRSIGPPGFEDLHLTTGPLTSAAKDAGVVLCNVPRDIDGVVRLTPWEIGADDISQTTAVTLVSFAAAPSSGAVGLSWATASELQNLGFHLYRADAAEGPYTRITPSLIAGLGSSVTGQSYSYRDEGLTNGRTYYYELEDVETTGRTERYGPVSAAPGTQAGACCSSPPTSSPGPSGTSYGDPSTVTLRELERSPNHVVLELLTGGFLASPEEDGRVRLRIPGFESVSRPGEPSLPMRRSFVEATAGRKVRLASILASEELRFPGLRPVPAGARGIEVGEEGTVLPSEEKRRDGPGFGGLFPSESALLLGTSFQGESKKAEVLLFPLRWDGGGLMLSRRLLVRLEFTGVEGQETSRGGSQGRRWPERSSFERSEVVAQIAVKERGLYRVDYEDVFPPTSSPRPRGLPASSLRVSRQGEAVAFHLEPAGALFGPGSSLYFLSEGADLNPYADAVYELEANASGLLMGEETLSPSTSRGVGEYLETVRKEENHYYQSGLLEAPDLWLWDIVVSPGSKAFSFATDRLASTLAGRLRVVLQGVSDFPGVVDHHVKVSVNGVFVGEATWDGATEETLEMEVPAGAFLEGGNSLSIEDVGDTGASYSMVFLNRFSVSYPRTLVAIQGTLEGRFRATGFAEIQGASASSFVLDTTGIPRWLRGASAIPSGLSVSVKAGRSYLVTSSVLRPVVKRLAPSTLKSPSNQADYLLLGPQAFLNAAQPLLDLRESQGLATKAVSLEEIYEQFGHGEVSPEAIKEFLEYAYHFWRAPSLRYVLLLGDASYDPKDNLETGVKDWLPGFPVRTSYLWTVSDPAYASVNGEDLLPDIAIGRLPAGRLDEALRMVEKTLSYENGGGSLDGPAVLVADNADLAGNFEANADEIASTLLASRNPTKIYYSVEGANTRPKIRQAFDDGAALMSYVGHGGTAVWASENVFNYQDVATLQAQPQQPLLMTMNCLNGYFQFPPFNSLSEALLKAEGKGVVAAFSPSGLSVNDPAHVFHKALLEEIVSGRHERIGDAVLAAQEAYAQTGYFPELSIYHLFGDPAMRIR